MSSSNKPDSAILDLGDELQFTESATTTSSANVANTHTFGQAPDSAIDADDDDQAALLDESKKSGSYNVFSVDFYRKFFDVDSDEVLARIVGAVTPTKHFLHDVAKRKPDLYGPFWICCTLVISVAVTGNLASYLQWAWQHGQGQTDEDFGWHYEFHKVTLAAAAVFGYAWLVPAGLYAFLWWTSAAALQAVGLLDLLCLYGYSMAVYVPVSVLWLIQISAVQWALVLAGAGVSGAVLFVTLKEVKESKGGGLIMLVLLALHFLLACGFMLYFFHVPPALAKTNTPAENLPAKAANETSKMETPQAASLSVNKRTAEQETTVEQMKVDPGLSNDPEGDETLRSPSSDPEKTTEEREQQAKEAERA